MINLTVFYETEYRLSPNVSKLPQNDFNTVVSIIIMKLTFV